MSRGTARIAVIADTHCPFLDKKAFAWALGHIRAFKPTHIVHLGDLFESAAASVHPNEYSHDQLDEYEDGAMVLGELEAAAPNAQRLWILGNHDANIAARDPRRVAKPLRRSVHWSNCRKTGHIFDRWTQIPYEFSSRGCVQLGQVFFYHDFTNAWDMNAIRMNNLLGGHGNRLGVHGHHHHILGPTQVMRTKKVPLPLWGASPGTLGPLQPEWANRQDTSHWRHGLCKITTPMGRSCLPKRRWTCETLEYGAD